MARFYSATVDWFYSALDTYAQSVNNPYPGSGRSIVRGPTYSDLDATITKTTKITERVSLQLSVAAYNALNQLYLGTGNPDVAASNFTSNVFNNSGGGTGNSSSPGNASGNRFVILGGRIIF